MTNALRFEVLHGLERRYEAGHGAARASLAMRREAVLSYEQIVAGTGLLGRVAEPVPAVAARSSPAQGEREFSAAELAREPRAYPMAPARPPGAARPSYVVVPEPSKQELVRPFPVEAATGRTRSQEVIQAMKDELAIIATEPAVPQTEPRPGGATHGSVDTRERSRLSPSQRAALKRPASRLDRDGRTTYVTYTVDATGEK